MFKVIERVLNDRIGINKMIYIILLMRFLPAVEKTGSLMWRGVRSCKNKNGSAFFILPTPHL